MTREHEKILEDLSRNLLDRAAVATADMVGLAQTCKIPHQDVIQAACGVLLFLFMDLLHDLMPKLTQNDIARIAEGQFAKYLEVETQRKARCNTTKTSPI